MGFNPVEFAKHKPVTTAAIVGAVVIGALVLGGGGQQAQAGNGNDFFLQGPSDAQIQASSNLQIAQAQIAAQNSQEQLSVQRDLTLAGIQRDLGLATLTVDDNKDARSNATTVTLGTLQSQIANSNNQRDVSIAQAQYGAQTAQVKSANKTSTTNSIIGGIASVASAIFFGL